MKLKLENITLFQKGGNVIMHIILEDLKKKSSGYWSNRAIVQIEYSYKLSKINASSYDSLISSVVQYANCKMQEEGAITKISCQHIENLLAELSSVAKAFKMIFVAHAHIDMNWKWRWDETVAITLETFNTMLRLMEEYPDFKFSQSQGAVYRIVEMYDPSMLRQIQEKVKEGRWEITASTWVEADKNMPNGESLARQILYTKQYLSRLFDLAPNSLCLDFEPDTFGHSINVPEILACGGVRYYYHCRGDEGQNLYRWYAPSGNAVTVFRDPGNYSGAIYPDMALPVPEFCTKYGMDTMLKVYGVGDHGGGPTRRDLESIIDMAKWPIFPQIRFGSYHEYFALTDLVAEALPKVEGERNFIFSGCYTSQSRIKMANRMGEQVLNEAELFNSMATQYTGYPYLCEDFTKAWKNVLFNQFHDILPGSGTVDTREHGMGLFQETMAIANTHRSMALKSIVSHIDTSRWSTVEDCKDSQSEGAGTGYGISDFKVMQTHRGKGKTRIFHFFNPSFSDREENTEITVWDWDGNYDRIVFHDDIDKEVEHQMVDNAVHPYWGHSYVKMLVYVRVPACGYSTIILKEKDGDLTANKELPTVLHIDWRIEKEQILVLENNYLKVTFDSKNLAVKSMIDKTNGKEFTQCSRDGAMFRIVEEDDKSDGLSSWVSYRHMNAQSVHHKVKIKKVNNIPDSLCQSIEYELKFSQSKLNVTVSLNRYATGIEYKVQCDWNEKAVADEYVPQLRFDWPVNYECISYKYDVPFGTIDRQQSDMDLPGNSWISGNGEETDQKVLMLVTDSKYGFRGLENQLGVTLIRSSYQPDPYPEQGIHNFRFAFYLVDPGSNHRLIQQAYDYNHRFSVLTETAHCGNLSACQSFAALEAGSVTVSSVKLAETNISGNRIVIRIYESEGKNEEVVLRFAKTVSNAFYIDINEEKLHSVEIIVIENNSVKFQVSPYKVLGLCIDFN